MRRTSSVELIVAMVKGPDAITRDLKHVSTQNIEPEAQQNIHIVSADRIYGLSGETVRKPLGQGLHGKLRNVVQQLADIDWFEGIQLRLVPHAVKFRVPRKKKSAAAFLIFSDLPGPQGQRSAQLRGTFSWLVSGGECRRRNTGFPGI